LLPALRRMPDPDRRFAVFAAVESRFGRQARVSIMLAGLTGLYMLVRLDLWNRFVLLPYWWMHAMVLVWAIFALMLFVLEPFVLHRRLAGRAARDSDAAFRTLHRVHVVLLALSLLTIRKRPVSGVWRGQADRFIYARVKPPVGPEGGCHRR
jgi:uncharacterized membrane protein